MGELTYYNAARTALQKAHMVDEVKEIRDKAEAMRAYARQAGDVDLQNWAAEIRLRAERRAGELLREMKERGERDTGSGGDRKSQSTPATVKLPDLGITRDQSSKWQKIAAIPEKHFNATLSAMHEAGAEVTTTALLREQKNTVREQQDESRRREGLAVAAKLPDITKRYQLFNCDFRGGRRGKKGNPWQTAMTSSEL